LYICELGSGSGRFAFHFLKRLLRLCAQRWTAPFAFRYVLTDFTQSNLDAVSSSQVPPTAQQQPNSAPERPDPPESPSPPRCGLGLDRLGVLQVLGGIALGLIALFSSYDHITLAGRTLQLQQQWGIPFIAASLAAVFIDAQLATGSRLRAADAAVRAARDTVRTAQDAARAEDEAARERDRADRERNRAAEARERQSESFKRLDRAALLSGRVQLDPTPTNRARFQFFLTLIADVNSLDSEE
jgi:hypothetical protein